MYLSDNDRDIGLSLHTDEQVNVNHEGCSAGEDRKKRLYIKRTKDAILYYCHHCSEHRTVRDSVRKNKSYAAKSAKAYGERILSLPKDSSSDTAEWPSPARVWVWKYGITDREIKDRGIVYSERMRRILIPCWNEGKLMSFQSRDVHGDGKPKYLSYGDKDSVYAVLTVRPEPSGSEGASDPTTLIKPLCIVEDVLSCIKVGRQMDSLALRKCSLSDKELWWIVKEGYNDFTIFLDDDNAQVKKQQIVLKNKLAPFGCTRVVHTGGIDPKELSDEEIEKCVLNCVP